MKDIFSELDELSTALFDNFEVLKTVVEVSVKSLADVILILGKSLDDIFQDNPVRGKLQKKRINKISCITLGGCACVNYLKRILARFGGSIKPGVVERAKLIPQLLRRLVSICKEGKKA